MIELVSLVEAFAREHPALCISALFALLWLAGFFDDNRMVL